MTDRHSAALLAFLLFGQLVLLSAQVPDRDNEDTLLSATGLRVAGPFARLVSGGSEWAERVETAFQDRSSLRRENERLRANLEELRRERIERLGVEFELALLLEAMDYEPPTNSEVGIAEVIYIDHRSWLRTLTLYAPEKTSSDQLAVGSPITTHEGLVGRVVAVWGRYARVLLITDRSSGVGAMIERTRRQGIVHGAGVGDLALDFVPLQDDVVVGDRVVTAGIDGAYPRGIPIGVVVSVSPSDELFHRIRVAPAVDFGDLDQVFVLHTAGIPRELEEGYESAGG